MNRQFYADISCSHANRFGQRICGDTFQTKSLFSGRRTVAVLSDGMGHGVKANILSTLTSGMMLKMVETHDEIDTIASMILDSLPVCEVRKVSYATFAIADINTVTGEVIFAHHDSPDIFIVRDGKVIEPEWTERTVERSDGRKISLRIARETFMDGDHAVMCTDGVTQSGQKSSKYRFGWGGADLRAGVVYKIIDDPDIRPQELAASVVADAVRNDEDRPADDTSCAVIRIRRPESLLFISCPPSTNERHRELIERAVTFPGRKIVCGTPVARILAEGTGTAIERIETRGDFVMKIPGFDLVTDGVIVPSRVLDIMENWEEGVPGAVDTAHRIFRMLLVHDHIEFLIGMKKTLDPSGHTHDIFELRRNILDRIAKVLENKYGKVVKVSRI